MHGVSCKLTPLTCHTHSIPDVAGSSEVGGSSAVYALALGGHAGSTTTVLGRISSVKCANGSFIHAVRSSASKIIHDLSLYALFSYASPYPTSPASCFALSVPISRDAPIPSPPIIPHLSTCLNPAQLSCSPQPDSLYGGQPQRHPLHSPPPSLHPIPPLLRLLRHRYTYRLHASTLGRYDSNVPPDIIRIRLIPPAAF